MWSTEIASLIKQNSSFNNTTNNNIIIGKVVSTNPLALEINNQVISKYIYINASNIILADDENIKIQEVFDNKISLQGGEITGTYGVDGTKWLDFLLEYHQNAVIKNDDLVLILQVSTAFYILEKVVLS